MSKGIVINGTSFPAGSSPFLTTSQENLILNSPGNADALLEYQPPVTDKDWFTKYGRTQESFMKLNQNTRDFLQGLPVITDQDYWNKFQMTKNEFQALPTYTKNRLLGVGPEYEFKTVKTQNKTQNGITKAKTTTKTKTTTKAHPNAQTKNNSNNKSKS